MCINISNKNTLEMSVEESQQVESSVQQNGQIFVKMLSGETLSIDRDPQMTVHQLKDAIHAKQSVPVDQQRLVFQGKQLEDNMTLQDYGIEANSAIHLILRLKGGF